MNGKQNHTNLAEDLAKNPDSEAVVKHNGKRNKIVVYVLIFFTLIACFAFALWWEIFRNYESTDDAYVSGNIVVVTSRQKGSVIAFYADVTDFVEQGQLLVELDPTDYLLQFEQKKVALELAARQVRNLFEEVKEREAEVGIRKAVQGRSLFDDNNHLALIASEAISKEDNIHSRTDSKVAQASLELALHQLEGAKAQLGSGPLQNHPLIEKATSEVREAYLSLKRCSIFAPVSGFVSKRNVQVGLSLETTTPLLTIIPLENIWIEANFKETQLQNIRVGQPVEVTADIYGNQVVFEGKIGGIQGGTGSVFSLLPPQNASGNWIKIVQRVPVRIYLNTEQVKKHPLLIGLSAFAKVDVSNIDGLFLSQLKPVKALMKTDVLEISFDVLDSMLEIIVNTNLGNIQNTDQL